MQILELEDHDWAHVWPIIREVVRAADTFTYDPAMTAEQAYDTWVQPAPGRTVVAHDGDTILGTAHMNTNRPDPGAHVAASNTSAVELYERHGFEIVGTVPGAFEHPTQGRVGLHVMYAEL